MAILARGLAGALLFTVLTIGPAQAADGAALPLPAYAVAKDIPGAKELPNPATDYKVVFDVTAGAETPDAVNPRLQLVARFLNTLAKAGVPAKGRNLAVVLHGAATDVILTDTAYAARNGGKPNPNAQIIGDLTQAGVRLHVCGQGVLGKNIAPADIRPEIEFDLWALTTIVNLQSRGYVLVGD